MKDKVILTDCDGVLFDWEYSFTRWMTKHGYILTQPDEYKITDKFAVPKKEADKLVRMFNESAWIRKLPPLRDAIKYVKKLHEEHGFIFHAITSLSNDYYAQHLRTKNLIEMFGASVFEKFVYLDTGEDKDKALAEYKGTGCYWVEDKPENAVEGCAKGLNSILINHRHNRDFDDSNLNITRVDDWKGIYNLITQET